MLHIRMIAVGDVQAPPAAQLPFILMIVVLQPVQVVQVPGNRSMFAVDLERVESLVPAGIARSLKSSQRSVLKARQEQTGIVDSYRFRLARQVVLPALDKSLC